MAVRVLLAAAILAASTGMWATGSAAATGAAPTTLNYICTLPPLPSQAMTAQLTWHGPTSVPVGQTTPALRVDATATVGAEVTFALNVIGATAPGTVVAPEGDIDSALALTVPATPVPASGSMTIPASGTTPGLVFHQPGPATVTVGTTLALRLTPRDANGNPVGGGERDLSCTLDPGQNDVVFSFAITSAGPAHPAPTTPGISPPRTGNATGNATGGGTGGPSATPASGAASTAPVSGTAA